MDKEYTRDLTQGSILKNLISFSIPLLLGNLLQALYNTVDSIWVGRFIGAKALGAVSVSFPIILILVSLVIGITMATTVLVSQYAGAKDEKMINKTINNSFLLLGILGIVVTLIGLTFSEEILKLMNTPEDILIYATDYLNIFFLGLIFMFGYNVVSSILRGLGDSKTPLKFLFISTILNLILDPIFILGVGSIPAMGIKGAAFATLIAQVFSSILAFRYLVKNTNLFSFKNMSLKIDKELTSKILKIGLPSGVQQIVVSFGMLVMASIINSFGVETVAAFGAASRLDQFAIMPAMSMSLAVSTLTGQNIGAGRMKRVKEVYKWGSILTILLVTVITIIILMFPTLILKLFTSDVGVLEVGTRYLRIAGFSYLPLSIMFITNGVLRGAGDTLPTMIFSITSLWIFRVPLAQMLSSINSLGSDGIWMAIVISSLVSLLMTQIYYYKGKWKTKSVINSANKENIGNKQRVSIQKV